MREKASWRVTQVLWDILWTNVHLATFQEGKGPYGAIRDGALAVHQGKIVWMGRQSDAPRGPVQKCKDIRDGKGGWLLPGFIDCHTHLVFAGDRADEFEWRLQGKSYEEIAAKGGGIVSTVLKTRAAGEDELFDASLPRLRAMMVEGVSTVEIKSGYGLSTECELKMLRVARALQEHTGVRVATTFLGAHAVPPEYAGRSSDYIDTVCKEMLPAAAAEGLVDAVDGFCENLAFTPDEIARVFEAAKNLGLPVKLHADQLSDSGGGALAGRYGALSADHLEYASQNSVEALAAAGSVAVLLPGAYYFLRQKRAPPIAALRRAGAPMAVASDCNPGSAPFTSLLLMLNMACTLFGLTPEEALTGVTRQAARALGLSQRKGTLEIGKDADLNLWRIDHPRQLCYGVWDATPAWASIREGG